MTDLPNELENSDMSKFATYSLPLDAQIIHRSMLESLRPDGGLVSDRTHGFIEEAVTIVEKRAYIEGFVDAVIAGTVVADKKVLPQIRQALDGEKTLPLHGSSLNVKLLHQVHAAMEKDFGMYYLFDEWSETFHFSQLLQRLTDLGKSLDVRKKRQERRQNSDRICSRLDQYCNSLFSKYGCLQVVRVDLGFSTGESAGYVSLPMARRYLNAFLGNSRRHAEFRGRVGYLWRVFWSLGRGGYYFHLVSFYATGKQGQQENVAEDICSYWSGNTAPGLGRAINCSENKCKGMGVGLVDKENYQGRIELRNFVILYIGKAGLYFPLEPSFGERLVFKNFSHGAMP